MCFLRALELDNLNASTHFKYSLLLENLFSREQVELHLIKAIQIKPLKYKALLSYADLLLSRFLNFHDFIILFFMTSLFFTKKKKTGES